MAYETLRYDVTDGVATIALDQPDTRNALSDQLLGERIAAREAERIGLVNRVASAEEFDAVVADWAQQLAAKSPVIMRLGKDAMFRQMDMDFADALDYLRAQLSLALSTEDVVEGVTAFFEKREPQWKGR